MKPLFGIFGLCYALYLGTQMTFISEMMSSKNECEMGILEALKSPDPLGASSTIDKSCARVVRNGDAAEKVLNKIP